MNSCISLKKEICFENIYADIHVPFSMTISLLLYKDSRNFFEIEGFAIIRHVSSRD